MLTIGIVTDIHHGTDNGNIKGSVALSLLDEALAALTQANPALLVDLGDRLSDEEPDRAHRCMAELGERFKQLPFPRHHLLGNHDFLPREVQERLLGTTLTNHSLELAGWQLIFLYTFDGTVGGSLSDTDLQWLKETLASSTAPAVVFTHQPLAGRTLTGHAVFESLPREKVCPLGHEAARRLLEASGRVRLAVSGHSHWNRLEQVGGIPHLTIASLVPFREVGPATGAHTLLTLNDDTVQVRVYGREPFEVTLPRHPEVTQ